jgi:hypothetical protein
MRCICKKAGIMAILAFFFRAITFARARCEACTSRHARVFKSTKRNEREAFAGRPRNAPAKGRSGEEKVADRCGKRIATRDITASDWPL